MRKQCSGLAVVLRDVKTSVISRRAKEVTNIVTYSGRFPLIARQDIKLEVTFAIFDIIVNFYEKLI